MKATAANVSKFFSTMIFNARYHQQDDWSEQDDTKSDESKTALNIFMCSKLNQALWETTLQRTLTSYCHKSKPSTSDITIKMINVDQQTSNYKPQDQVTLNSWRVNSQSIQIRRSDTWFQMIIPIKKINQRTLTTQKEQETLFFQIIICVNKLSMNTGLGWYQAELNNNLNWPFLGLVLGFGSITFMYGLIHSLIQLL